MPGRIRLRGVKAFVAPVYFNGDVNQFRAFLQPDLVFIRRSSAGSHHRRDHGKLIFAGAPDAQVRHCGIPVAPHGRADFIQQIGRRRCT